MDLTRRRALVVTLEKLPMEKQLGGTPLVVKWHKCLKDVSISRPAALTSPDKTASVLCFGFFSTRHCHSFLLTRGFHTLPLNFNRRVCIMTMILCHLLLFFSWIVFPFTSPRLFLYTLSSLWNRVPVFFTEWTLRCLETLTNVLQENISRRHIQSRSRPFLCRSTGWYLQPIFICSKKKKVVSKFSSATILRVLLLSISCFCLSATSTVGSIWISLLAISPSLILSAAEGSWVLVGYPASHCAPAAACSMQKSTGVVNLRFLVTLKWTVNFDSQSHELKVCVCVCVYVCVPLPGKHTLTSWCHLHCEEWKWPPLLQNWRPRLHWFQEAGVFFQLSHFWWSIPLCSQLHSVGTVTVFVVIW